MDWYLMVWRKYAQFDGRSRRTEYWMFLLFNFLAMIALGIVAGGGVALIANDIYLGGILCVPFVLYVLALIIPSIAVGVRRFHDTGKSGWLLLVLMVLGMIPFLGFIASVIQIVMLCIDSDPGMNQYGPNPKFPMQAAAYAGNAGFVPMGVGVPPQPVMAESNFGFCGGCGSKLKDSSPFCGSCGAHV